jgi:hypothetical protein
MWIGFIGMAIFFVILNWKAWTAAIEDWRECRVINESITGETSLGIVRFIILPALSTAVFIGSSLCFAFGPGPTAMAKNVVLHHVDKVSKEALEAEVRQAKELELKTRGELQKLREELTKLRTETAEKLLREKLNRGTDRMMEARKRLLEREGE